MFGLRSATNQDSRRTQTNPALSRTQFDVSAPRSRWHPPARPTIPAMRSTAQHFARLATSRPSIRSGRPRFCARLTQIPLSAGRISAQDTAAQTPRRPTMPVYTLTVNGQPYSVEVDPPSTPLLYVLMDDLELNGPTFWRGVGQWGACTVLLERQPIRSCGRQVG